MPTVLFAGAGTAGHVEPGLAVAHWLRQEHPEIDIKFLGTPGGVENNLVPAAGFQLLLVEKTPFPRRVNKELFTWPLRFRRTLRETRTYMVSVDLLVGFGGYVAAPAYLAARRARIPIIAHEANAKMGLANRLAVRCGGVILRAFVSGTDEVVGIPLRDSIVALAELNHDQRQVEKIKSRRSMNLDPDAPTILVFGGSLGSVKFNEAISQAQRDISKMGYQIIHAVGGKNEVPLAQAGYLPMAYIQDMASAYAASDLVISRSGAVTVTETGVLGIYSLYVPLPIGNGEQAINAQVVSDHGGGEVIPNKVFNAQWLIANIERLMTRAQSYSLTGIHQEFPLDASAQIGRRILKELINE